MLNHKVAGDNNCFSFNFVYQKGRFRYKIEKVNTTIEFCILELVLVPNFSLNWQFRFFGPSLPKRVFPVKNRRSEHRNWILHIRISQGIQFQLTLTFLFIFFFTKFVQKGYFRLKTEKSHLRVRPWSLLTILNFSARKSADTTVF